MGGKAKEEHDVFKLPRKPSNEDLLKWRDSTFVLNPARRFRYTAKIKEHGPIKNTRFRSVVHLVVATLRFQEEGAKLRRAHFRAIEATSYSQLPGFHLNCEQLCDLNGAASLEEYEALGGALGIAKALNVDVDKGIKNDPKIIEARVKEYGSNTYPHPPVKTLWSFLWEACQDSTLIILIACAIVSLIAHMITEPPEKGWYEGAGISLAVIIVVLVTGITDYRQSLQFLSLNAEKANIQLQVVRDGRRLSISIYDIVVGDIIPLAIGDQVPADGVLVSGHSLIVDESSMTGESHPIHKDQKRPFLVSGCKISDGFGTMLVTGVGTNTEWGRLMTTVSEDTGSETPLQVRLEGLTTRIGHVGLSVAFIILAILIIRYFTSNQHEGKGFGKILEDLVEDVSIAITLIVVAVPEGLPLAVTLTLAYSMGKMMADKALVRTLAACETMGSATSICSDKTGTLTLNQMTVVRKWVAGKEENEPSEELKDIIFQGIAQNSSGSVFIPKDGGEPEVSASPTETAIIKWGLSMGLNFESAQHKTKIVQVETFNSKKKRAGVCEELPSGERRVHWKGAAEIVLSNCSKFIDIDNSIQSLNEEKVNEVKAIITSMAEESLRCLALAYRPLHFDEHPTPKEVKDESWKLPDQELILIAVVGIKDPCRPMVPEAVNCCQRAGVKVRMVTGDNPITAKAIAAECGILTPDGIILEGKDFRVMSPEEMKRIIPRIDVLARSSPTDKHTLVKMLQEMDEVVAVTGDGTNDAPALHEADIGLSMGISGTEVAKESSDIVILDDNFSTIVKVLRWGRAVYSNLQKFIQFQLTVNISALVIVFVAACSTNTIPLKTVQLLWVNLLMNTFGALAFANEPPTDDLLIQSPIGRFAPIITNVMWRNMLGQVVYQLAVEFSLLYRGRCFFDLYGCDLNYGDADKSKWEHSRNVNNTIIFNSFVFCQIFNEISSRKLNKVNIFEGLLKNRIFLIVIALSMGGQIIIVTFLNDFAKTTKLTIYQWIACFIIGLASMPVAAIVKFLPVPETPFSSRLHHAWMSVRILFYSRKSQDEDRDSEDGGARY